MDTEAKIRLGDLILLTTAVPSLISVLIVDSWPVTILSAIVVMATAAGGLVWVSCRQQHQFIERLKRFDIDPEKGRVSEANLRCMYCSSGQTQKDAVTLIYLSQKYSMGEAHAISKKRSTRQEISQMTMQQSKGRKHPHR